MMIKTFPDFSRLDLLRLVPQVLRARGWRLYTKSGRLVDLWQYGGRAILGHNPPGLLRAFKNSGERGLFAPFPHFAEDRFLKALSVLIPGYTFRLYDSEVSLRQALNAAGLEAQIWRPFLNKEQQTTLQSAPVLLPVLPCSFPGAPAVLGLNVETAAQANMVKEIPPSQILSPAALVAAARCIYDLLAVVEPPAESHKRKSPQRGNPHLPKTGSALKKNTVWKRQGIYLYYKQNPNRPNNKSYADLFQRFLEGGFLLPPSPEDPVILPGELSPGEDAKLAGLLDLITSYATIKRIPYDDPVVMQKIED